MRSSHEATQHASLDRTNHLFGAYEPDTAVRRCRQDEVSLRDGTMPFRSEFDGANAIPLIVDLHAVTGQKLLQAEERAVSTVPRPVTDAYDPDLTFDEADVALS